MKLKIIVCTYYTLKNSPLLVLFVLLVALEGVFYHIQYYSSRFGIIRSHFLMAGIYITKMKLQ
ncbi:MAG: hypothetical protein ACI90V_002255 [Bacillariaceae sp.]|jgi:hypothetical protein